MLCAVKHIRNGYTEVALCHWRPLATIIIAVTGNTESMLTVANADRCGNDVVVNVVVVDPESGASN